MSTATTLSPERVRRIEIIDKTREMLLQKFQVEGSDDVSVILSHKGFYLQVLFSSVHPLLIIYLAKSLDEKEITDFTPVNAANAGSLMGSHSINQDVGSYAFRSTHWLENPLTARRFSEILERCSDEASKAYDEIMNYCCK